jgi:hypothetical protein
VTAHMTGADEVALSAALEAVAATWRACAREIAEGNWEDAERWADFAFAAFAAFEAVDDGPGWRARDVLLLLEEAETQAEASAPRNPS